MIGFEETQYSVDEGDGTVTLDVVVLQGVVSGTVRVRVSTEDRSATCECIQSHVYSLTLQWNLSHPDTLGTAKLS